ncbi:MAG: CopD family protein [Gammaproteobacteria bacterium]|nr:CopD family protein [Gammaproteobacteria bacterium]MDH5799703.1 CopD family protein [Gammaproteobacteria bacterium]
MLWVVAFHIIFVIVWFSGLFYLPRLFVYHAMCNDQPGDERFKVMERKLYIMTHIGAVGATVFGLWLLFGYAWTSYADSYWLTVKLVFAALLIAYHVYCGKLVKDFKLGRNVRSHKFYRVINELPVIPLLVIVILVVVKPF